MGRKRWLLASMAVVLVLVFAAGCGSKSTSPSTSQSPPASSSEPVKGGTLTILVGSGPQVLGYFPQMGPADSGAVFPAVETIMDVEADRNLKPFLAKSVVEDQEKLTFTITLNEGIKFHDGTELTAEVAAWNYQLSIDNKKIGYGDQIKSIEVKDKYTLVLNLTGWNNQMIQEYGWVPMFSKEAFEKNGKEWAMANPVGTGPFKLEEFKRDVSLSWVKNDDYWQKDKGMPYLDRIEVKVIPDPTTASSMMQAGEADVWQMATAKDQSELQNKGFIRQDAWAGMQFHVMPNTMTPGSKWNNKKLREALEYALDKAAIAKALGYGFYEPLTAVAPPGSWGGDIPGRAYNPEKAKQLLAEAGYPNGLKVKLLTAMGPYGDSAEAIKGYLDAVGIQTDIDVADPGRFFGSVFGQGWEDLALMFSGMDVNYLVSATRWWSHQPKTNLASFKRPQALIDLFDQAWKLKSEAEQKATTEKIVQLMADEALMIPVFHQPNGLIVKPGVHTTYPAQGFISWDFHDTWKENK